MTTTTQTLMTSVAIQSLDPSAVSALTSLKAACTACEDADNAQGKKGAEEAGDTYDGACQDDAKKRFLTQGKAIIDDMWATFNALQDGYQSSLRPHENVGPRLHQVYTYTWVVVGEKIAPVISDVQKRQQQDHWTGAGADDYIKQLPVQLAALNEFSQYVSVAGAGSRRPPSCSRRCSPRSSPWPVARLRRSRGTRAPTLATTTSSGARGPRTRCRSASTGLPTT